jgi:hypothetical protein
VAIVIVSPDALSLSTLETLYTTKQGNNECTEMKVQRTSEITVFARNSVAPSTRVRQRHQSRYCQTYYCVRYKTSTYVIEVSVRQTYQCASDVSMVSASKAMRVTINNERFVFVSS